MRLALAQLAALPSARESDSVAELAALERRHGRRVRRCNPRLLLGLLSRLPCFRRPLALVPHHALLLRLLSRRAHRGVLRLPCEQLPHRSPLLVVATSTAPAVARLPPTRTDAPAPMPPPPHSRDRRAPRHAPRGPRPRAPRCRRAVED